MKFKENTIIGIREKLQNKIDEIIRDGVFKYHVSISRGNSKIGHALNVSLAPLVTCGNCGHCAPYCYDIKAVLRYVNVLIARSKNTAIYKEDAKRYFEEIRNVLQRRRTNKYFRWHVGGEIPDAEYFAEMVKIAREFPDFVFWTYTKMYGIVNMYVKSHGGNRETAIPENLKIMFSEWDGTRMYNPYNFPFFTCKLKDGNKNHKPEFFSTLYKCPGNCDICRDNGRGCIVGESTYADEH